MKTMTLKSLLVVIAALCVTTSAFAQVGGVVMFTNTYTVNQSIPDNDLNGLQDTRTVNFISPISQNIADLNVTLNITGEFNGDLYAYLQHGSGFAVLLNRVGRTASNPDGYSDDGVNVRFDDQAGPATGTGSRDVHTYRLTLGGALPNGTQLTGSWLPDGRNPAAPNQTAALDTDARTALLSSFGTFQNQFLDPNGQWTLFVADVASGSTHQLVSWGLEVTIPEPGTVGLMAVGGVVMFYFARRRLKKA